MFISRKTSIVVTVPVELNNMLRTRLRPMKQIIVAGIVTTFVRWTRLCLFVHPYKTEHSLFIRKSTRQSVAT